MTEITMKETPYDYVIIAKGHATGNQDVCAAISMMLTSVANWVVANGSEEEQKLEEGDAVVVIPKKLSGAKTIFSLCDMSFSQLEKNYGDFAKKVQILGKN